MQKITDVFKTDLHESLKDKQIDPSMLSPFQKILLIADGTLTNILEVFLNEPIGVIKLSEEIISVTEDILPLEIKVGTEVMKRQILLQGKISQQNWLYANSMIVLKRVEEKFRKKLIESHIPIGKLWVKHKTETFKEIVNYAKEPAGYLSDYFEIKEADKLLSRTYRVFSNRQPVMMITEKFPDNYFF
ncbi:chorismate pyruvate-lyase family protein [Candidatus Parabeggiatoa sp. HSG14]|uniref:chorismate--pyruvate lyase family protein n=1 Tax=Candidatus Parabeggiatoa sp. HSG14 TaxID=3055593 RepID=UPI0032E3A9F4